MHDYISQRLDKLVGGLLFVGVLVLYISTMAPWLVFGDPAEYTFVPHIWGIAHPPGYAFQTVLGGIWQRLIPIGSIAFRANLLSATAGATIATLVYGTVVTISRHHLEGQPWWHVIPAVFAGLSAAAAPDIWQHSLHANAHIVTTLLATTSVFLLITWWHTKADGWLFAFCVVAGISVTHHPLLVFGFPAYTLFILSVRHRILFPPSWQWKTLLAMVGFGLLGLTLWVYLPLRNMLPPPLLFGPENTDTLNGFLDLVFARGLRVNLFAFGWPDQPARLTVFWSLLRLQAHALTIGLMLIGLGWLWHRQWRVGLLVSVMLLFMIGFVINTIQDVMAYLMTPFAVLMVLAGVGVLALFDLSQHRMPHRRPVMGIVAVIVLALPVLRMVTLAPHVSLRDFDEAQRWVDAVYTTFEGQGEEAYLLAHWEHLTPLWYEGYVDHPLPPEDLRLVFVAANSPTPWVDNVRQYEGQGPLYVSGYQPGLIQAGYRLRPIDEQMYQVVPAGDTQPPPLTHPIEQQAGPVTIIGVSLPQRAFDPGERIPLVLTMQVDDAVSDLYFPYVTMGETIFDFTTDSHVVSPNWLPGEVIAERYDIRVPFDTPHGDYPLELTLRNLTQGQTVTLANGQTSLPIGSITVAPRREAPAPRDDALAIYEQQIGLVGARVSGGGGVRTDAWTDPLRVQPYDRLSMTLRWRGITAPDENWKVFVHVIDGAGRVVTQVDAPPLGGAFPTYLWFPKWVTGQEVSDPYQLTIPGDLPAGDYAIQVGLYGFNTFQRARLYTPSGDLSGDRFILGPVQVVP